MYLQVTYLPGSVVSQGAIDLASSKLLATINKIYIFRINICIYK